MSIEISGQKGYEFQDRVCALLAILAIEDRTLELFIEPVDGEDARLVVMKRGTRYVVEIQVKSEQGEIDTSRMIDWLAHFPSHKTRDSLLENLIFDKTKSVMFVAGGRCSDATAPHLVPISVSQTSLKHGKVKAVAAANVRTAISSYALVQSQADRKIDKKRREHLGAIIQGVSGADLQLALQRVMIVERLKDADLMQRMSEVLQTTHRVLPDHVTRVIREIEEIIVRQKRKQVNVLSDIAAVIRSGRATDPLRSPTHVGRDEEALFQTQISKNKVVLITGAPRVGKSFLARSLAASLQKLSFRVQVCSGVEEASRYLLEPVIEFRAALVDDPLGGSHISENAGRELSRLEQLIPQLGDSRRLIIAQAQDRLLQVTREQSVQGLVTAGQPWVVLGPGSPEFLCQVWKEVVQLHQVPLRLAEQISQELQEGRLLLEPGCLMHLASRHHLVDTEARLEDLVRIARQDAKTLGISLREEALAPLMTALAIASTPELRVGETELAFILDPTRPVCFPGMSNVNGIMTSFGAADNQDVQVSVVGEQTYESIPRLDRLDEDRLDKLEIRRMVSEEKRSYTFNHPFYRASAESLVDAATRRAKEAVILQLERAIFTAHPSAAKAAATNLDWVYQNLSGRSSCSDVIEVAKSGLKSIFPAVRDLCFSFLVKRLPTLPHEEQGEVSLWVTRVSWPCLSFVIWNDDEPRIPPATLGETLEVDPFPKKVEKTEVKATLALLNSDCADKISTQEAARAIQYLTNSSNELTVQMAARLLSFDVALIRAPVAKAWLRLPREDDKEVLDRIFSENHPAVARAAYKGVIQAWPSCKEERKTRLIEGLQKMAASPVTAAALVGDLVLISREECSGTLTPWRIFDALMPVVLKELPVGASLRDERLYTIANEAIGNISNEAFTVIIEQWLRLVIQLVDSGRVPSDYMLGVGDIIISVLPFGSVDRLGLISRLLAVPGTASRIRIVADLVMRWDDLSDDERSRLLDHLVAGASDEVWIQAAALTRSIVPAEIEMHLLHEATILALPPQNVIARMDPELLSACIHVFTGIHSIIYYVGVHGARNPVWGAVVSEIASIADHEEFEAAWEWLLMHDLEDEMVRAVQSLGPPHADRVAELVLKRKCLTNGEFHPEVWSALFSLPVSDEQKTRWLESMVEIAPLTLRSAQEAQEWIPQEQLKEFYSLLQSEIQYYQMLYGFSKSSERDSQGRVLANLVSSVKKLLLSMPPKLLGTYDHLNSFLKKMAVEDEILMSTLADLRSKALKVLGEGHPDRINPELRAWVG